VGRLGVFILGCAIILFMMRGIKPAMTGIFNITNNTSSYNLSMTEQVMWQIMPYLIPLVLFGILVAWLTGKIGGHRDEGPREE